MAEQQSLNDLLKWSIENSTSTTQTNGTQPTALKSSLNPAALAQLLGGPSDADRMRGAMAAIVAPHAQVDLENKLIAWDNLEQLIEQIDNANNLASLGLWTPLLGMLEAEESEQRSMAAWCVSTAVQNNVKCQEHLLGVEGGIGKLVEQATGDTDKGARKKAVSALSSEVRNFQPGLNELLRLLPESVWSGNRRIDAGDMEAVDELIGTLRSLANQER